MSTGQQGAVQKVPGRSGKLMRLRCRLRPLHDECFSKDKILEEACDVTFYCQGGQVRAHKIILAMASKFFALLFRDQKPHKPSFVSVPDIPVGSMRLIILLCYKDRVSVGMKAMEDLGKYLGTFGLAWDQFNFSEAVTEPPPPSTTRKSAPGLHPISRVNLPPRPSLQPQQQQQKRTQPNILYAKTSTQQTFVLDTESNDDGGTYQESDVVSKQQPRPRLILPKPGPSGQGALYRTTQQGPPILRRMSTVSSQMQIGSNSHSIEMNLDDESDTEPVDTPEAKKLMQEWMASLGKSSGSPPKLSRSGPSPDPTPVKRKASPIAATGRSTKGGADKSARMQCSVCNNVFDEEDKWRWHEERHVGLSLFKCTVCDQILPTARKVYQHEMMEHGIVTTGSDESNGTSNEQSTSSNVKSQEKTRVVRTQTQSSHNQRVSPATSPSKQAATKKIKTAATAKLHENFAYRNPNIQIGHDEGEELVDGKKLRQLHWLYICEKCEFSSDSTTKATAHYEECYPEKEVKFEDSVIKVRQGFYGKCKCPLCPRKYTSVGGFHIHCGHMHNAYKKKFSHIVTEDVMLCVTCRGKFALPEAFHAHLNEDQECDKSVKEDSDNGSDGQDQQQSSSSTNQTFEESRQKQYAKLLGTNPRSARLQNRLAAVTACFEDDTVDEETLPTVTCPICGTAEIKNLSTHLNDVHPEIDVKVERFEMATLRCKACAITFATCDLLAHNNSCTGSKGLNYVAQRKASVTNKVAQEPQKPKEPFSYPEGIGCSPVDTQEFEDLTSVDLLRKQFQCPVCKKHGKKMKIISDCMKNHGVYRCAICFNTYLKRDNNSQHLKKCHGTTGGKLICPICNIVRANAGQLVSHMYAAHWQNLLQGKEEDNTGTISKEPEEEEEEKIEKTNTGDDTLNNTTDDTLNTTTDEVKSTIESKVDDDTMKKSPNDYSDLTLTELLKTSDPAPTTEKIKIGDVADEDNKDVGQESEVVEAETKTMELNGQEVEGGEVAQVEGKTVEK